MSFDWLFKKTSVLHDGPFLSLRSNPVACRTSCRGGHCFEAPTPDGGFRRDLLRYAPHTDKKENKTFLIYKEIRSGTVSKSYMTNGLLIYGELFAHFLIY